MFDSAYVKLERASEHIGYLSELIRNQKPFTYILETNAKTGERSVFAKKNEAVISRCAAVAGDAIHNLRAALDHAYFEVVEPVCTDDGQRRQIQFPFSKTAHGLEEAVKNRLAHKVGDWLFKSLMTLNPHGERGGNELLWLVHDLDMTDKHRLLIPAGDYKHISFDMLRAQVLDLPAMLFGGMGFGNARRDIVWSLSEDVYAAMRRVIPPSGIFEQELNVPVEVVFRIGGKHSTREFVATLHAMADATKVGIEALRKP